MKCRLDQMLVERGFAPTRSQARDLVLRGCVKIGGAVAGKAGMTVADIDMIEVAAGAQPYVSRGGLKLVPALEAFAFDAAGRVGLDIGASTGGFTDVLLERGADRVFAVDVGHGQLALRLAGDPRVISLEGLDARRLDRVQVPVGVDAIVADVSFVSLTKVLGPALALASPGAWLVALIKPQFEVGRAHIGKGGIVKLEAARQMAVGTVRDWLGGRRGWRVAGVIPASVSGGAGNQEYLIGASFHE